MSEVLVTKRSERNKLMDNLKKSPIYHALVVELIEMELSDLRTAYEDTSPASEFFAWPVGSDEKATQRFNDKIRGQLNAIV